MKKLRPREVRRLARDHTAALWQGEGENLSDTPPGAPSISTSSGTEQMPKKYLISYIIELGPGSLWGSFQAPLLPAQAQLDWVEEDPSPGNVLRSISSP